MYGAGRDDRLSDYDGGADTDATPSARAQTAPSTTAASSSRAQT
eukprot:CAMPEP_0114156412 /NCGR_PEP_ID=MMETSP0043_2-20121206/26035_1 /TAXON_ID=464988 /ORGANISM="Hemiselmis andersenii, Strain CCMP644" /LENGTH=43 /DNA_ID= /DNA_START= /DNA_END= /DNA_ORIENTATION=